MKLATTVANSVSSTGFGKCILNPQSDRLCRNPLPSASFDTYINNISNKSGLESLMASLKELLNRVVGINMSERILSRIIAEETLESTNVGWSQTKALILVLVALVLR
jgi:hypothetical protein